MKYNRILRQITREIYLQRPNISAAQYRTNYRIERANGGLLCDLWFLSAGCTHDAGGGCAMCNYGRGERCIGPGEQQRIVDDLRQIVTELPFSFEDFLLTPSGSMLDEREVPLEMREKLIAVLKGVRTKRFIIETRADTISERGLEFLKQIMPGTEKYVEIGLESSSNWILKHCINKNSTFEAFCSAVNKVHDKGFFVTANVGLGFPFMSERASIRNTIQTVQDALNAGADSVVIFPYHIKHGTLLDVMYRNGLYECVSFWALVKVLSSFAETQDRIQISWYKDYFGPERSYIYRSPYTCPFCGPRVMDELDHYRESQDQACVERLSHYPCKCRQAWEESLHEQSDVIEIDRVEQMYRKLAGCFDVDHTLLELELTKMKQEYREWIEA